MSFTKGDLTMLRYIDADALKAKYEQMLPEIGDGYHKETLQDVLFELEYAPTVSPEEVRGVGKWLNDVGEFGFPEIPCSVCGYKSGHYGFKYCPNCGAHMEVSEDA